MLRRPRALWLAADGCRREALELSFASRRSSLSRKGSILVGNGVKVKRVVDRRSIFGNAARALVPFTKSSYAPQDCLDALSPNTMLWDTKTNLYEQLTKPFNDSYG